MPGCIDVFYCFVSEFKKCLIDWLGPSSRVYSYIVMEWSIIQRNELKAFITSTESSEPLIMKISKEFWIREWKFSYVVNDNLMSRKRKRNPSIHTYSSEYLLINVRGSEVMCGICLCLTLYNWQMIYLTAWHFKIKIDNSRKVTLHIWNVNVM